MAVTAIMCPIQSGGMMRLFRASLFLAITALVVSCDNPGGVVVPYRGPYAGDNTRPPVASTTPLPESNIPTTEWREATFFQLGRTERQFPLQTNTKCRLSPSVSGSQILLVEFQDPETQSLLSMTVAGFNSQNQSVTLSSTNGSAAFSLGGDERQFAFSLGQGGSCEINYRVSSNDFRAAFSCFVLTSQAGETQTATGEISCQFEQWMFKTLR